MPENYVEGSTVNCVLTFQGECKAVSTCIFQPIQLFKYLSVCYNAEGCCHGLTEPNKLTVLDF